MLAVLDHLNEEEDTLDVVLRKSRHKMNFMHRLIHFHGTPYVKFTVNVISYIILLLLYSFIILTRFKLDVHPAEYVLQGWVLTLLIEELRQLAIQEPKALFKKIEFYFQDPWNIVDSFSLMGFLVATILRYIAAHDQEMKYLIAARIIYATDIVLFIVRLLQIFSVNRNMGPKLVMIRKMLNDLVYFVVILAVFVIGYGVAKQAVLYPNMDVKSAIVGVLNRPYWQMYGELFIEDILEEKLNQTTGQPICKQPNAEEPCLDEYGQIVAPMYMAVYMLFTNILLLNLLIAIFNYTFEKVQEDSDKVWKFQRYDLILEYHNRPNLVPPFIIITHIIGIVRWIAQRCRCCGCKRTKGSTMKIQLSPAESEQLLMWEFVAAENYVYESTVREAETQDERVKQILQRVHAMSEEIDALKCGDENQSHMVLKEVRPETRHGRRSVISVGNLGHLESRLTKLEQTVEQILELVIQQNQRQGKETV